MLIHFHLIQFQFSEMMKETDDILKPSLIQRKSTEVMKTDKDDRLIIIAAPFYLTMNEWRNEFNSISISRRGEVVVAVTSGFSVCSLWASRHST